MSIGYSSNNRTTLENIESESHRGRNYGIREEGLEESTLGVISFYLAV